MSFLIFPFWTVTILIFLIGSKMFKEKALEIIYLNMEELKPKFRLRVVRKIMIFDIE